MPVTRRNALVLGAVAAGFAGLVGAGRAFWPAGPLVFEEVARPEGYRRLIGASGSISLLGGGFDTGSLLAPLSGSEALCDVAFRGASSGPGRLAIASFSDFFCPYCRVLDQILRDLTEGDPDITVIWHQVPLLGRPSELAARGAIAAANQGAYRAYQARLIRTSFVPNRRYLRDFAQSASLDETVFLDDLESAETQAVLDRSHAAFRTFGFVGTPGLAVGRTLINGAVSGAQLRALISMEKAAVAPAGCRSA